MSYGTIDAVQFDEAHMGSDYAECGVDNCILPVQAVQPVVTI